MKKYKLYIILPPKPFLTRRLSKLWTLFHFTTIIKLIESFTLPIDKISFKQKQNIASLCTNSGSGADVIENKQIR